MPPRGARSSGTLAWLPRRLCALSVVAALVSPRGGVAQPTSSTGAAPVPADARTAGTPGAPGRAPQPGVRDLAPGTVVRARAFLGSCTRAITVVGVLDTLVDETLSLRIWSDFEDRTRPPVEPFALPLVTIKQLERAPEGRPLPTAAAPRRRFRWGGSRTAWLPVPMPADVRLSPSCPRTAPYQPLPNREP